MTFNTRSLLALWRQRELAEYLRLREVDVAALQETRCRSELLVRDGLIVEDSRTSDDGRMISVVVTGEDEKTRIQFVTAHAPHGASGKEQLEDWWEQFNRFVEVNRECQQGEGGRPIPLVVLGDLNARARGRAKTVLRQKTNTTAVEFENWLHQSSQVCCNAKFTKPENRLVTFTGSKRSAQLDVITIEQRWQSACTDCYSIQPPVPSDHRPLIAKFTLRLRRKRQELQAADPPPDWSALQLNAGVRTAFEETVHAELRTSPALYLEALVAAHGDGVCASEARSNLMRRKPTYSDFAAAVRTATSITIPPKKSYRPERHTAAEDERAKIRSLHDIAKMHKDLQQNWTAQINNEVTDSINRFENLAKTHPSNAWREISRLAGKNRGGGGACATKSTSEEILQHFIKVNGKERGSPGDDLGFKPRLEYNEVRTGPVTVEEAKRELSALSSNKAVGLDGVPAEVVKLEGFRDLMRDFATRYLSGEVPKEVLMSELVLLEKKGDSRFVQNCRGISLTSVFLKFVNRILLSRLRVLDKYLAPWQNGFRPHRNTVQHAMALKLLIDRAKSTKSPLVVLYIDFTQAFPSVTFDALRQMLKAWKIPDKFANAIMQCYDAHEVYIRNVDGSYTVRTGVLQGDTLAPLLFCMLLDCILHSGAQRRIPYNPVYCVR